MMIMTTTLLLLLIIVDDDDEEYIIGVVVGPQEIQEDERWTTVPLPIHCTVPCHIGTNALQ